MSICLALRPDAKAAFKQLNRLAETADYNVEILAQLKNTKAVHQYKETVYYLASLYLQLGENEVARELLSEFSTASNAMKRFFHVLVFSRRSNLPLPKLNSAETDLLDYLEKILNPPGNSFESVVLESGGFSVVGNAPGASFQKLHEGTRLYFNNYQANKRIHNTASVHVVTPSWDINTTKNAGALCITGNNIFYRRSRVWMKFKQHGSYTAIYTVPVDIWRSLYKELGASPSAGLLLLCWMESIAACHPRVLGGYVAGFSSDKPSVNHSYDAVPPSTRHDWVAETVIRKRLLSSLRTNCASLSVES